MREEKGLVKSVLSVPLKILKSPFYIVRTAKKIYYHFTEDLINLFPKSGYVHPHQMPENYEVHP